VGGHLSPHSFCPDLSAIHWRVGIETLVGGRVKKAEEVMEIIEA
jgi:hypothetical protein